MLRELALAKNDPPAFHIIRADFNVYPIARHDTNAEFTHFTG